EPPQPTQYGILLYGRGRRKPTTKAPLFVGEAVRLAASSRKSVFVSGVDRNSVDREGGKAKVTSGAPVACLETPTTPCGRGHQFFCSRSAAPPRSQSRLRLDVSTTGLFPTPATRRRRRSRQLRVMTM